MEKIMRSMLFCPGNNPKLYYTAPCYEPDCIIFDLEDSIELSEKDAARDLLVEGMKSLDFGKVEIFVRVNAVTTPFFEEDIKAIVPAGVRNIRLPMCQSVLDVKRLDELLSATEDIHNIERGSTKIQVGIETPKGVLRTEDIAGASDRVIGISFGAEDYTASLGIDRTKKGKELLFARSMIVNVASMYGITATDTVWADINDSIGFIDEVKRTKALGFNSKSCIHPSQIELLHDALRPTQEQVGKARIILDAVVKADVEKGGVISVNGKMVDVPVITKARKVMDLYEKVKKNNHG
jgi:citrate lyase subunit beta/citryl-CoA lyase